MMHYLTTKNFFFFSVHNFRVTRMRNMITLSTDYGFHALIKFWTRLTREDRFICKLRGEEETLHYGMCQATRLSHRSS